MTAFCYSLTGSLSTLKRSNTPSHMAEHPLGATVLVPPAQYEPLIEAIRWSGLKVSDVGPRHIFMHPTLQDIVPA